MKLKILLNRESPKFIAKLISLSIYSDLPRLVSDNTNLRLLCFNASHNCYTRFFVRKIGYINFVPKSVRRPSVCASVRPSVTFLVIVSSPKGLDVATSNFVGA